MKISLQNKACITSLALLLLLAQPCFAQYYFELVPGISLGEEYDDNIDLESTDEKSDYITTVSPSLSLSLLSEHTGLELFYEPTFVWYCKEDYNNTVRHSATLTFGQDLTQYLRLDLTNAYLKSEEPMEENVQGVRHTRNPYQRNDASASLSYLFGPENELTVGFRHYLLENEDPAVDDGTISTPFATVAYLFNAKNGLAFEYEFADARFSRDDGLPEEDDYTGNRAGITYIYRFTPHATGALGYNFTNFAFDGPNDTENFKVHEGRIGYEQAFAHDLSVSAAGGYFLQDNEQTDNVTGPTYEVSVEKTFDRGSFTIGGSGGWDVDYLEPESRGFTRYLGVETSLEYQLLEPLNGHVRWSYRRDKDQDDREWETWRRNCGQTWIFLRWFSLSLDYTYDNRDDDDWDDCYSVHRVTLMLTASKLYRW